MFSNRVEITLISILGRRVLDEDPIGYDESETEIGRSEKTHGIFLKQINNLEFTGSQKRYLEDLWQLHGPQARCRLIRKEKHPTTDEWQLHSDGFLDFTTRKIKDNKFSIDFVEGGLREVLTSQMREKFELNRTTDINGKVIPDLITDTLALQGREIYLLSKFGLEQSKEFDFLSGGWQGGVREAFYPVPMNIISNSDPENLTSTFEHLNDKRGHSEGGEETRFLTQASRDIGKVKLQFNIQFYLQLFGLPVQNNGGYPEDRNLSLVLRRYSDQSATGGSEFYFEEETVLVDMGDPIDVEKLGDIYTTGEVEIIYDQLLGNQLKKGDSLGLYYKSKGDYDTPLGWLDEYMNLIIRQQFSRLTWSEDSYYPPTTSKCLTAYEVGKRLSEIYTGKPCFDSYLLEGKDNTLLKDTNQQLVFSPGGWIRNLKKQDEDEQGNVTITEWPIEFSFENFYKSIFAITPVGYGISTVGNRQNIVFEDLNFFFQRTVLIHLGKIKITERSTAVEFCYQSLKFGYTKGGEYEKPLGLDEYNTQTAFRSPLTITDNEYNALGESRTDSYGAEDARRMQYKESAEKDTPYDKDNFLFDVKNNGHYEVRTWEDDFETPPTSVYSPETAYNLNLSPGRNRQRHEYWFTSGFYKLKNEAMQFLNSKGNSTLKTKKAGEAALKESAPAIPVTELDNPLVEPEWIDAEADFDQKVYEQITGTTIINGREVNNYYGLAEFTNNKNRVERAFIYTVKVKDKFTFKLLKSHGI